MNKKAKALAAVALTGWCAASLWASTHAVSDDRTESLGVLGIWEGPEGVQEALQGSPWVSWVATHQTPGLEAAQKKEQEAQKAKEKAEKEQAEREAKAVEQESQEDTVMEGATQSPTDGTVMPSYMECGANYQQCIDNGNLTYYVSATTNGTQVRFLAGHDYDGWHWLSSVPVGQKVEVPSGSMAGTYEVYGHHYIHQQGGFALDLSPLFGSDLVLQTCQGLGTGFSLLRAV